MAEMAKPAEWYHFAGQALPRSVENDSRGATPPRSIVF